MKIAFIYMASGFGRRFGENKLLIDFHGKPLYMHGLSCLQEVKNVLEKLEYSEKEQDGKQREVYDKSNEEKIEIEILVVSQYEQIRKQAERFGIKAVQNMRSDEGITA